MISFTMKTRNMTREQVIYDILLDAQPTKEFVTADQVGALALSMYESHNYIGIIETRRRIWLN
jgi:hypothetical protein